MLDILEKEKTVQALVKDLQALTEHRFVCTEAVWKAHDFRKILWENGLGTPYIGSTVAATCSIRRVLPGLIELMPNLLIILVSFLLLLRSSVSI